jgi:hypothetical protein
MHIKTQILFLLLVIYSQISLSQIFLEYREVSLVIDQPLPNNIFEPRDKTIVFSNTTHGIFKTYTQELLHWGLQFRNAMENFMYNSIIPASESDSTCREQSCFHRSWFNSPILGVHGRGTKLYFMGPIFRGDNTYTKTSIALTDHGHLVIGRDVVVDMVFPRYGNYTRQMWIFGDGTGIFELEEGFQADRSKMGTTNVSFGSVRLSNVNFVTHNSQAIPHYYMMDDNNPELVLLNAHLVFENDPGGKWIIKTQEQQYAGGIQIYTHAGIETEKDLLLNGAVNHWPNKGYYDYGGIVFYADSLRLTKSGESTLTFDCDMFFNPGSMLDITEGRVIFRKDTYSTTISAPGRVNAGNHLSVRIGNGTEMNADTDTLHLDHLFVGGGATLVTSTDTHLIINSGNIEGMLVIDLKNAQRGKTYRLFSQGIELNPDRIAFINKGRRIRPITTNLSVNGTFQIL